MYNIFFEELQILYVLAKNITVFCFKVYKNIKTYLIQSIPQSDIFLDFNSELKIALGSLRSIKTLITFE